MFNPALLPRPESLPQDPLSQWIILGLYFLASSTVLIGGIMVVLRGFAEDRRRREGVAESLRKEIAAKKEAARRNKKLREDMKRYDVFPPAV